MGPWMHLALSLLALVARQRKLRGPRLDGLLHRAVLLLLELPVLGVPQLPALLLERRAQLAALDALLGMPKLRELDLSESGGLSWPAPRRCSSMTYLSV